LFCDFGRTFNRKSFCKHGFDEIDLAGAYEIDRLARRGGANASVGEALNDGRS
jgi:hypothetical protein